MQQEATDVVVDCRGQICPMPVFMLKGAIAEAQLGKVLEVIVDDESSRQNVIKYCWNHGQEVLRSYAESSEFHLFVRRSIEKKADSPMPAVGPCGTRWE
jgi:TusA-related sulfurtransferase